MRRLRLPDSSDQGHTLTRTYRGLSLLAWFVEVWFAAQEFRRWQAEGEIPASEPFDPTFFVSLPGDERSFPLMLSAGACGRFRRLALEGAVRDFSPSFYIGRDASGTYRAISWLLVSDGTGVVARTAMRAQQFPAREQEAIREVVLCELDERLRPVIEGHREPLTRDDMRKLIRSVSRTTSLVQALQVGGGLEYDE